jgi:hypothetical protein
MTFPDAYSASTSAASLPNSIHRSIREGDRVTFPDTERDQRRFQVSAARPPVFHHALGGRL